MKKALNVLVCCAIFPFAARALITGDNTMAAGNPLSVNGFNWDYIYNYKYSSAVAVDSYWILTAAHVADDPPSGNLTIGNTTYIQQEIVYHGSADLALVRYDKALPGFYDFYSGPLYVGDDILMIGYGNTGSVTSNSFTDGGSGAGTKRWGSNEIDGAGWLGNTYVLAAEFDQNATVNEAGVGIYDSGGGSFIYDGSDWKLLGINISRGPVSSPYNVSYMASVPSYQSWIAETVPEPSTAMLVAGFSLLIGTAHRIRYLFE